MFKEQVSKQALNRLGREQLTELASRVFHGDLNGFYVAGR
jgi:hypothetical protein